MLRNGALKAWRGLSKLRLSLNPTTYAGHRIGDILLE